MKKQTQKQAAIQTALHSMKTGRRSPNAAGVFNKYIDIGYGPTCTSSLNHGNFQCMFRSTDLIIADAHVIRIDFAITKVFLHNSAAPILNLNDGGLFIFISFHVP